MTEPSNTRRGLLACLCLGMALTPLAGHSQGAKPYPAQNIRLIVPFSPGGATDIVARVISEKVAANLGQSIYVENKPGAGTTIGSAEAAKAAPDGYTLLMVSGAQLLSPAIYKNLTYDPLESFAPIARLTGSGQVMTVPPSLNVKSVQEFIALAKAKPGSVNYGSSGNGSNQHLGGALFAQFTGAPMTHVPYKGSAQVITDLLAGRIQVSFMAIQNATPLITSGKLRPLAVTARQRWVGLPDVPTFTEVGYPGVESAGWIGIVAPRATPQPVIARVFDALKGAFETEEVRGMLRSSGTAVAIATPTEFAAIMRADSEKLLKLASLIGLQAD